MLSINQGTHSTQHQFYKILRITKSYDVSLIIQPIFTRIDRIFVTAHRGL